MAINMSGFRQKAKHLVLVFTGDESIDWDKSDFPTYWCKDAKDGENDAIDEKQGIEAKKQYYRETFDSSKLVFKNETPTCFVFRNPEIMENNIILRDVTINCAGIGKKESQFGKLSEKIWRKLFVGHFNGKPETFNENGADTLLQKPFLNKILDSRFVETCFDLGILEEMATIIQSVKKS